MDLTPGEHRAAALIGTGDAVLWRRIGIEVTRLDGRPDALDVLFERLHPECIGGDGKQLHLRALLQLGDERDQLFGGWIGAAVCEESASARWQKLIADQKASGLRVSVFCRERGIPVSSLFAKRRRLAAAGTPDTLARWSLHQHQLLRIRALARFLNRALRIAAKTLKWPVSALPRTI